MPVIEDCRYTYSSEGMGKGNSEDEAAMENGGTYIITISCFVCVEKKGRTECFFRNKPNCSAE